MLARWTRIIATPDGGSRFADGAVLLADGDFAPPAPPLGLSPISEATATRFIGAPAGWDSPAHPAPARQWVVMLGGAVEATTSDGASRVFGPGDAVLVEDTHGAGHRTRVASDDPWLALVVELGPERS
jgi:hypothetical protein